MLATNGNLVHEKVTSQTNGESMDHLAGGVGETGSLHEKINKYRSCSWLNSVPQNIYPPRTPDVASK